jgi:hypothetical protein
MILVSGPLYDSISSPSSNTAVISFPVITTVEAQGWSDSIVYTSAFVKIISAGGFEHEAKIKRHIMDKMNKHNFRITNLLIIDEELFNFALNR